MIIPIILSVVAAFFWATGNHIDKYLISKTVKKYDYRSLILISTIFAGGIMTIVYLFACDFQIAFDIPSILLLLVNSVLYVFELILYYKALSRDDTTIVVIMFQLVPVFMLLLSPFTLHNQYVSLLQLIGGLLIMFAAIFITYEPKRRKFDKKKLSTLAIMTIVSIAEAIWFIVERYVNQEHDFNQTVLWSNMTLFVVGIFILIFIKSYRKSFSKMLKSNGLKVVGLNFINEILNSSAVVFSTCAGTMASVALVSFVAQGVQPFAVMLIGILVTKLFPKVEKERVSRIDAMKRIVAIIVCAIGLGLIEFG